MRMLMGVANHSIPVGNFSRVAAIEELVRVFQRLAPCSVCCRCCCCCCCQSACIHQPSPRVSAVCTRARERTSARESCIAAVRRPACRFGWSFVGPRLLFGRSVGTLVDRFDWCGVCLSFPSQCRVVVAEENTTPPRARTVCVRIARGGQCM